MNLFMKSFQKVIKKSRIAATDWMRIAVHIELHPCGGPRGQGHHLGFAGVLHDLVTPLAVPDEAHEEGLHPPRDVRAVPATALRERVALVPGEAQRGENVERGRARVATGLRR